MERAKNWREMAECRYCKNHCRSKFVDDDDKDCKNFIPKRISAEEKYLREHFFYNKIK